jgi:hypothetical protein
MILKFVSQQLKWQAASILGSVDFLGSPLGFVNDVTEGVSGLLFEGNVQALVQNVTHGLSNSAAKVTGKHFCHGLLCPDSSAGNMFMLPVAWHQNHIIQHIFFILVLFLLLA